MLLQEITGQLSFSCQYKAPVEFGTNPGFPPNRSKLDTYDVTLGNISKSVGNEPVKTTGIKMRGTGAATKGVMCRGPMA